MGVFKCKETGTWYVMTRYRDWKGERKQKCKRGFATKRAAQDWEQKIPYAERRRYGYDL